MPWDITWESFWIGFWPNFVSSIIAGILISGIFAFIVGKILDEKKRKLEKLNSENKKLEKTKANYQAIKNEIIRVNEGLINKEENINIKHFIEGNSLTFDTPAWKTFELSGELPKYLKPEIVVEISRYFGYYAVMARYEDRITSVIRSIGNNTPPPQLPLESVASNLGDIVSIVSVVKTLSLEIVGKIETEIEEIQNQKNKLEIEIEKLSK